MRVGQKYPSHSRQSKGAVRSSKGAPRSGRGHSASTLSTAHHRPRRHDYRDAMNRQLRRMQHSVSSGTDWAREKLNHLQQQRPPPDTQEVVVDESESDSDTPLTPPFPPRRRPRRHPYVSKVMLRENTQCMYSCPICWV